MVGLGMRSGQPVPRIEQQPVNGEVCTMMRLRSKILAGVSVVATAAAVAVAGLTAASASPAAASSGFEHFQIVTTSPTGPESIIARGVFTAGGVTHPGSKVDTAVFSDGTFTIAHSGGTGTPRFNPKTCLGVITLNGTYRIGHGTGAYAGISGHGIYRLNILLVVARNSAGKCGNKTVAYQQIIRAQGPLSL
jgi:hypothetical protein